MNSTDKIISRLDIVKVNGVTGPNRSTESKPKMKYVHKLKRIQCKKLVHRSANVRNRNRGKRRNNEAENIFEEVMADSFPKLMKDINSQTKEALRNPSEINKVKIHSQVHNSKSFENQREEKKKKTIFK